MTERILYLTDIPFVGGGEINIVNIAVEAVRRGWNPLITAPGEGPFLELCERRGLEAVVHPMARPYRLWGLLPWIPATSTYSTWRLMKSTKAALVHANSFTCAVHGGMAAALLRIPAVWTCRGWDFRSHGLRGWFLNTFTDRIIVISEWVRKKLLAPGVVEPSKVVLVRQGVDVGKFRPPRDETEKLECRRELGLPEDAFVIGICGSLYPLKGHARLFEAVASSRRLPARTVVAAAGAPIHPESDEEKEIMEKARTLGLGDKVRFLGRLEDTSVFYRAIDVLAAPSEVESFGMAIIEAMASGVCVIATDRGAPPENVTDGKDGFLLDPFDVPAWRDRLERIWSDPHMRRKVGLEAAATARRRFTMERYMDETFRVYEELLRKNARRLGPAAR